MKINALTVALVAGINAHNATVAQSRQIGKIKFSDYDGNRYTCTVWERPDGLLDCMVDFRGTPRHAGDLLRTARLPRTVGKLSNLGVLEGYAAACKYPSGVASFSFIPAV